jgi:hypothetical protein
MAQARRRRQTKHRGNAAGMVEARGRTGRKPTAAEKRGPTSAKTAGARANRFDRPPTWRGAFVRAMAAAVLMLAISIVLIKKANQAIALFPIVLIAYVPISYYTDLWLYKRRMASKTRQAAASKAAASNAGTSKAGAKAP